MNNKEIFMDIVANRVKNSVDTSNITAVRQAIFHTWADEEKKNITVFSTLVSKITSILFIK